MPDRPPGPDDSRDAYRVGRHCVWTHFWAGLLAGGLLGGLLGLWWGEGELAPAALGSVMGSLLLAVSAAFWGDAAWMRLGEFFRHWW